LLATFWWIHEREFGQRREEVIRNIYSQMSNCFVNLLLDTNGSVKEKLLNNLGSILAQSVWLCFWVKFSENRAEVTKPSFLSALYHDCAVQISGRYTIFGCKLWLGAQNMGKRPLFLTI
jgi:hypothetical protein